MPFCHKCGFKLREGASFCPSCGVATAGESRALDVIATAPSGPARNAMTKRAKILYSIAALSLFSVFLLIFARNLPGGENPVITKQPEVSMGSIKPDAVLNPSPITVEVGNGRITFPLAALLEKRMVGFDYQSSGVTIPLIAFITGEGKLVTAVAICEPCNSHTFRIEGSELACGNCETRWKLNNLEGIQGACQKYPPAPIPSIVVGNEVQIDEGILKNWKMRI